MTAHAADFQMISAQEALRRMKEGNERFLRGSPKPSAVAPEALAQLAEGQRPYAAILCCSDSRVPPERVFDAGFGELFVARVAGHVLSPEVAGSLHYAGMYLRTPLLVVLGHDGCGAVRAAVRTRLHGEAHHPSIQRLVDLILPGLSAPDPGLTAEEYLLRAVEENVRWTMRRILESPDGPLRKEEGARLAGAVYDMRTGRVRFLD